MSVALDALARCFFLGRCAPPPAASPPWGAEGSPAAPVMLRVGRMSPGARLRPERVMGMGYKLMSTWMEVAVDEGMSGEEVLRLFGRFEPLHLPLSSSRRPMRVLGPVVQISALSVLDAGK